MSEWVRNTNFVSQLLINTCGEWWVCARMMMRIIAISLIHSFLLMEVVNEACITLHSWCHLLFPMDIPRIPFAIPRFMKWVDATGVMTPSPDVILSCFWQRLVPSNLLRLAVYLYTAGLGRFFFPKFWNSVMSWAFWSSLWLADAGRW